MTTEKPVSHPLFEIVTTSAGAVSIRNKALNETMHNPVGPWLEANGLYIEPTRLREKLALPISEELVVFDVGLGAAANALAALHCARSPERKRPFRMISFERELELLRFAVREAHHFAHFAGYIEIIESLLNHGSWSEDSVHWELRHGDFFSQLALEEFRPHIIFYDPYSHKVNRDMWTEVGFRLLREKCRSEGTLLCTYSQSTPVRVALFAAGFWVGRGLSTGFKEETTQAATRLEDLIAPLGSQWFTRWQKSRAKFPFECTLENQRSIEQLILNHPQFRI